MLGGPRALRHLEAFIAVGRPSTIGATRHWVSTVLHGAGSNRCTEDAGPLPADSQFSGGPDHPQP